MFACYENAKQRCAYPLDIHPYDTGDTAQDNFISSESFTRVVIGLADDVKREAVFFESDAIAAQRGSLLTHHKPVSISEADPRRYPRSACKLVPTRIPTSENLH